MNKKARPMPNDDVPIIPYRVHSWSGSESQRHEQGDCRPPAPFQPHESRFFIPKGTVCSIRHVNERQWRSFCTRRDLEFNRCYSTERTQGTRYSEPCLVFRLNDYLIRIPTWRFPEYQP